MIGRLSECRPWCKVSINSWGRRGTKVFSAHYFMGRSSREAAQECSPRRKPWVESRLTKRAPTGRKRCLVQQPVAYSSSVSSAPSGLGCSLTFTHGLRRGLHSFAASRLAHTSVRGGQFLFFNRVGRRCLVQRNGCIFTSHQGKMHIERSSKRLTRRCTPFLPSVQKCGPIVCVG